MDEKKESASLATMIGTGIFIAQDKTYSIFPIKLKHIDEFKSDQFFIPSDSVSDGYAQYFTLQDEKSRKKLDKWIQRQVKHDGLPMSLELAYEHDWDIADIGRMLKTIVGLSG